MECNEIVPFETAQTVEPIVVPFEMAQIPKVLFSTGWTNHQIILNRCKSDQERLFYILYAGRERLQNKELTRAITTNTMNSILGGKQVQSETMAKVYPSSPVLFKEKVYLDMLGRGETAFTLPLVPTGMKTGVWISPLVRAADRAARRQLSRKP